MSIEIKGHNPLQQTSTGQTTVSGHKAPAGNPAAAPSNDSVSLTAAALEMNRLENQASIDHVRVAAIRQAINEQRYSIDSNSVSKKFQQFTLELERTGK